MTTISTKEKTLVEPKQYFDFFQFYVFLEFYNIFTFILFWFKP